MAFTLDMAIVLGVSAGVIVLFVREVLSPDIIVLLAVVMVRMMEFEDRLLSVGVFTLIILGLSTCFVFALWVAPFLRAHGRGDRFNIFNPLFTSTFRIPGLVKELGYTPWFVRVFYLCLYGLVILICALVLMVHFA